MTALLHALDLDPAWLAKAIFEANLLALFAICLAHSLSAHGWQRTFREFSAGFALTALAESTGVLSGAYVYPGFQFYIWATPVANPASWVALVYVIMTVSDRLLFGRRALTAAAPLQLRGGLVRTLLVLACLDAWLALSLDLVLDPLATVYNWWLWVPVEPGIHTIGPGVVDPYNFDHQVWMETPSNPIAGFFQPFFEGPRGRYPTRVLGIPLINFIAWFVFVFTYTLQNRWIEHQRQWSERRRTLTLWGLVLLDWPVLALLLIAPNL